MITFKNNGLIDKRSITTFGVSSKESESPIGIFGTGLKYAIAIILRHGLTIEIDIGGEVHRFSTKEERIRVDDFLIVTMNDVPLGFTTQLGKTWELWQAFRELYCNCTDENGEIGKSNNKVLAGPNETVISVLGEAFEAIYDTKNSFILESEPIVKLPNVNIHAGGSKFIFYRGISVLKLQTESLYTYNLTGSVDLTEDRTLKYLYYYINKIAKDVTESLKDSNLLKLILHCSKDKFLESTFEYAGTPSQDFLTTCRKAAENFDTSVSRHARKLYKTWNEEAFGFQKCEMNSLEQKMLIKSVAFCKFIGYADIDKYPIHCTEVLGEDDGVLGRAYNKEIYLARRVFLQGTKQVAVTLLEEYFHIKYGLVDETYKMQTFLFDVIGSLGERLMDEPL